jgi:hypothetical protein
LTALSTIVTGLPTTAQNRSELLDSSGHHRRHAGQDFSTSPVNLRRHTQTAVSGERRRDFKLLVDAVSEHRRRRFKLIVDDRGAAEAI